MKDKIFFYISNKKQTTLYKENEPLFIRPGRVDYKTIFLSGKNDVCVPPSPDDEDTTVPKGQWVVRGRVTDENSKGKYGLTVSLFDKEGIFTDRLGTVHTDKNGHFIAKYEAKNFTDLIKADPDIYISVFDNEGKALYSSRKKIKFKEGGTETFRIKIKKR